MKTLKFKISGMHCPSCEKLIAMQLEDLSGVISSSISAESGEAIITTEGSLKSDTIVSTIKKAGYNAELLEENNEAN